MLISKKIIYSKNKNTSRTGGGGGKRAYIKTPWISFFPRKTSLLVHTFMCISRSWLFFRVYKRANALLIKILIQKLSFYKSNHFLTHNLDFWIKLLTILHGSDERLSIETSVHESLNDRKFTESTQLTKCAVRFNFHWSNTTVSFETDHFIDTLCKYNNNNNNFILCTKIQKLDGLPRK